LGLLAAEYAGSGRAELFREIKVVLTEGKGAARSAVLAERLKMSEDAVNIATHRLRKRYREILEAEIAQPLPVNAKLGLCPLCLLRSGVDADSLSLAKTPASIRR
jgi:hypothetical protein